MTEVAFHFNAPDKLAYACRLLRKAVAAGSSVTVTAEPDVLRRLDVQLWTFAPLEFVPHCSADADVAVQALSPVVLTHDPSQSPHHQVLVNLGTGLPGSFERFERLIEVVALDDEDRQVARPRWKHYADRGYSIVRHDLKLKEQSA